MPEAGNIFFECDPEKNTACSKESCYIHGGPCHRTRKHIYAKDPDKMEIIIPTDGKEFDLDEYDEHI